MTELLYKDITGAIIGACYEVYNHTSRTYPEYIIYFNPAKKAPISPKNTLEKEFAPSTEWLYPDLAYQIIGGLHEVHAVLGAGFVYRIYANACYYELGLRGLAVKRVKRIQVDYKGTVVGDVAFAHILVEGKVMVFPVALHRMQDIRMDDLKRWMGLCDIQLGIIANFDAIHLEIACVRI